MKVKNYLLAIVIVTVASFNANSQVEGSVGLQTRVEHREVTPTLDVYAEGPIEGKFGWSAFVLTSKSYSQAYGGLTYSPKKWVTLSVSIGMETNKNPWRLADSVLIKKGKWSVLHIDEYGGSGYWTKNIVKYQVVKSVAVGGYAKRFFGVGPYVEKNFGKKFTLWGTVGFGYDRPQGLIGVKYNF